MKCKLCSKNTETIFNINLKATPVCNKCGRLIAMQEIKWLFDEHPPEEELTAQHNKE